MVYHNRGHSRAYHFTGIYVLSEQQSQPNGKNSNPWWRTSIYRSNVAGRLDQSLATGFDLTLVISTSYNNQQCIFLLAGKTALKEQLIILRRLLPTYANIVRAGKKSISRQRKLYQGIYYNPAEGDNIPADARVVEEYGSAVNNAS